MKGVHNNDKLPKGYHGISGLKILMEAIGMFKIREYFQVIIILMGLMVSMLFLGGCSEKTDLFIPPSPDVVVNQPEVQKDEKIL